MKVTYNSEEVGNLIADHYRKLFLLSDDAKLVVHIRHGDKAIFVEVDKQTVEPEGE